MAHDRGWSQPRPTAQADFADLAPEADSEGAGGAVTAVTGDNSDPPAGPGEAQKSRLARALEAFNRDYAYVAIGQGVVAHLRAAKHPVEFLTRNAFLALHMHPEFPVAKRKDGSWDKESIGDLWWKGEGRRSYRRHDFLLGLALITVHEDRRNERPCRLSLFAGGDSHLLKHPPKRPKQLATAPL